jgi:hypothetical protein
MGTLNHVAPITETRHDMIPAQPGWFRIGWEGDHENPTIFKEPIVAWLVENEFYPRTKYSEALKTKVPTMFQECFSQAYPVTPGGYDFDNSYAALLGPDGCVYQLNCMGLHWPDIPAFVEWSWIADADNLGWRR